MGAVVCSWTLLGRAAPGVFLCKRHFSNSRPSMASILKHLQVAPQAQLQDLRPDRLHHRLAALAGFQTGF